MFDWKLIMRSSIQKCIVGKLNCRLSMTFSSNGNIYIVSNFNDDRIYNYWSNVGYVTGIEYGLSKKEDWERLQKLEICMVIRLI